MSTALKVVAAKYRAGEDVPLHWWKLKNVRRMVFGCDCMVTVEDTQRVVRATSNGDCMIHFTGFDPNAEMSLDCDPPLFFDTNGFSIGGKVAA